MIALTGATGQLGHYVLQDLLKTVPASQIVAIVRNPAKAQSLSQQGVVVRQADYSDEAALTAALQGVDKLLLISSSEVGQRAVQHRNVINAAKAAGVTFIAYTSLLHADTSPLGLAAEHIETEQMLADSGIAYALLRNGWYTENYLASAPPALEHGVFIGAAGEGKIASATRADYAAAAARVIAGDKGVHRIINARARHQRENAAGEKHGDRAAAHHSQHTAEQRQRQRAVKRGRHHRNAALHGQPVHHPAHHAGEAAGGPFAPGRVEQDGKRQHRYE